MFRIVYISRSVNSWHDIELEELALGAATLNRRADVTGLLLYDGLSFIQALEGPEDAVRFTMVRIAKDRRHTDIRYFDKGKIEERQFGTWSMRFKKAPEGCCSETFINKVKTQIDLVSDHHLRAAFIGFAALSSRRPAKYVCEGS